MTFWTAWCLYCCLVYSVNGRLLKWLEQEGLGGHEYIVHVAPASRDSRPVRFPENPKRRTGVVTIREKKKRGGGTPTYLRGWGIFRLLSSSRRKGMTNWVYCATSAQ